VHFPVDWVIAQKMEAGTESKVADRSSGIPDGWSGFDIGPESRKKFKEVMASAKTIVWNGPMGVIEIEDFSAGTKTLMEALTDATAKGATTVVGGGETAMCAEQMGAMDKVGHVSTGGGAALELLEGKELPGVTALTDRK